MSKFSLLLLSIALASCNGLRSIKTAFQAPTPYERYVSALEKAELLNTGMARAWLAAGEDIFHDSVVINLPFSESGYFQASNPEARSYRFRVRDGQVLTVNGAVKTQRDAALFADLFLFDGDEWKHAAAADSTLSITYEFSRDQDCVLRLQPELLTNTYFAVNISITPVLINPVYGATNRSIGSFYGAPRDNGRRSHEGVDIFAPRGTPVVAPTDGYVSRVGHNNLGGKVVWMKDARRGHSYYFAHLDSQMVKPGMHVRQGHVLGLVGNTGNARTTPPHLHFGIYQSGSKDPLYYIRKVERALASIPLDTGFQQKPFETARREVRMLAGPDTKLPVKARLERDTYLTVVAQSGDWYRVRLPDHSEGYVPRKHVAALSGEEAVSLSSSRLLRSGVNPESVPVAQLEPNTPVKLLARFGDLHFVITEDGGTGWLPL